MFSRFVRPIRKISLLFGFCLLVFTHRSLALVEPQYVENTHNPGDFCVAQGEATAPVYVDTNDYAGVIIAANNLCADVNRVTGHVPDLIHAEADLGTNAIIIGTIGKSRIIDQLIRDGKIDVSAITDQWESYFTQVVPNPLPGVANSLVIVGSDKRGTIYGIYDLSAAMGVSPWYWWADVPVRHQDAVFVKAGKHEQGPPAVKYRGIFLNDEAPDLTGWVNEKFGDYNHAFYTNVFELMLRLKANYLWPAMWNNCFSEDDPLNPKLADEYGIVMGTSHVEPMMRADKEWNRLGYTAKEWNYLTHSNLLDSFWKAGLERNKDYENIITIGMRGKIDTPMSETANIKLLEEIVAAQRKIIAEVYHTNAAAVPQLWALYKEVQEYYEKGMRVPDDVTLLWCDDNWGDIRRLPSPGSRYRSGGAGVYYHFDYVGGPRNYKWVNTNPTTKIWEQMNLAYHYNARQIWIVNVGHLKGYELPIQFFMNLAWDPQRWPKEKISEFTRLWAEQQFGREYAPQIADILTKYTKYNGWCKPELLGPNTFSLVDYLEAHRVLADWKAITAEAEDIYQKLPAVERDAFFELVLYPTKACEQVNDLYITTAKNRLYAAQGRASTDDYAARARALFKDDADLSYYYNHVLAGGKWDHMMDQTHIGYTSWQQPPTNVMPEVEEIDIPTNAEMGIAVEGSTNAWPGAAGEPALPEFDVFNQPRQYIDVFNRGQTPFEFLVKPDKPWIELSAAGGTIEKQQRLWVKVDWARAPKGSHNGYVKIAGAGKSVTVRVAIFNPQKPTRDSLKGFVEANGYVSIEAVHYTKKIGAGSVRWEEIPNLGRTLSAMSIFPVTAPSVTPPKNSPCLEYQMYLFHPGKVEVEAIIDPTLNFIQGRGLRYAISFDDWPPQIVTAVPADYNAMDGNHDWETTVENSVRKVETTFTLSHTGYHTLKFWMVDPGVVLQKLVVNLGGVKPSYLGSPESFHSVFTAAERGAKNIGCPQSTVAAPAQGYHWVGTWEAAPQLTETGNLPPAPGLTDNTLRQVVQVSIGGKHLRVRFSNAFGTSPVTISSAHIAQSAGGSAIKPDSDRVLTFQGKPSVTIPPGESVLSDAFDFNLAPLSDVAVTIDFGGTSAAVTGHPGSRATSYLQAGDWVSAPDLPTAAKTEHWYILNGVDVLAGNSGAAIVTLGDSITDGRGSGTDKNDRWPDDLARRLQADPNTANVAVLNEGIGGNCVLHGGLGPPALTRLNRDVLSQSGVRWLIVLEGVNDIGGSSSDAAEVVTNLIAAYEKFIEQAHAHHICVYGATIMPFGGSFYDSPAHEAARQTVNHWIRTSGKFDAVIDFDAVLRDPQRPLHLLPAADSGDHLHPNERGYEMMADAINLKLFEK